MGWTVKITPAALHDLQVAIDYYNSKIKGLGRRFENTVHQSFLRIEQMPQSSSFAYEKVRYKVIDQFPYLILYEADGEIIKILRVFNTFLDPDKL